MEIAALYLMHLGFSHKALEQQCVPQIKKLEHHNKIYTFSDLNDDIYKNTFLLTP